VGGVVSEAISLYGRFTAKAGMRSTLLGLLSAQIELVRENEPGVEVALLHTVTDDEDAVVLFERYADVDALATHQANNAEDERYVAMLGKLRDLLAGPPEITRLNPEAGFTR
jgi:quinol monooxygenase YgiN